MIGSWTRRVSVWILLFSAIEPGLAAPEVTINSYRAKGNPVTLRLSVRENGEPIPNLDKGDFQVRSDGRPVPVRSLVPPSLSRRAPTRLVILLDTSNSMTQKDGSGKTRQQGAIEAIEAIIEGFQDAPLKINLVPFGEGGGNCRWGGFVPAPVSSYLKEESFLSTDATGLKEALKNLENAKLCASTNLYDPLSETIDYLRLENEKINVVNADRKKADELPTRFAIILISDGFHSTPSRFCQKDYEPERFEELRQKIRQASTIMTVHTLGYGKTPAALGREWGLSRPATVRDVLCSSQRRAREQEFVDRERLAEIARSGQGVHRFSGSASEISRRLEESVNAILGEYELTYLQPNARAGQSKEIQVVLDRDSGSIESEPKRVRMEPWYARPALEWLLLGTLLAFLGVFSGVKVFSRWSARLQENR